MPRGNRRSYGVELRLIHALAEDLKQPLLRIAYKTELAKSTGNLEALAEISTASRSAMQLIDTLLLGFRTINGQLQLELTPIAPAAVLQEVESILKPHAAMNNCIIEVEAAGKQPLAMVHPESLTASLVSLGQVMIDLQAGSAKKAKLKLVSYQSHNKPRVGVFASGLESAFTQRLLKQTRALYGRSSQPAAGLMSVNSSGVFIAEQLLRAQSAELVPVTQKGLSGLTANLLPSRQMALV